METNCDGNTSSKVMFPVNNEDPKTFDVLKQFPDWVWDLAEPPVLTSSVSIIN
jgi:hypothetical protein